MVGFKKHGNAALWLKDRVAGRCVQFYPEDRIAFGEGGCGLLVRTQCRLTDGKYMCPTDAECIRNARRYANQVFRCNGCDTMEGVKVYPELMQAYCQSCADDLAMPAIRNGYAT